MGLCLYMSAVTSMYTSFQIHFPFLTPSINHGNTLSLAISQYSLFDFSNCKQNKVMAQCLSRASWLKKPSFILLRATIKTCKKSSQARLITFHFKSRMAKIKTEVKKQMSRLKKNLFLHNLKLFSPNLLG